MASTIARANQSLFLFPEGNKQNRFIERDILQGFVYMSNRNDAGPIINRTTPIGHFVIMCANYDLLLSSPLLANNEILNIRGAEALKPLSSLNLVMRNRSGVKRGQRFQRFSTFIEPALPILWMRTTMRSVRSRSSCTSTKPVSAIFHAVCRRIGWATYVALRVAEGEPGRRRRPSRDEPRGNAIGRPRARNAMVAAARRPARAAARS